KDGRHAARIAINREQGAQLAHKHIGGRQRITGCSRRTGRRALPAASANLCVDRHMIAGRRNGAGRTKVEAAAAAGDLRSRMGAKSCSECNVTWLVEAPDEIARPQYDREYGGGIARIGTEVTVAQV